MKILVLGVGAAVLSFYLWGNISDFRDGRAEIGKWGNVYVHRARSPAFFWVTSAINFSLAAAGVIALLVWLVRGK